MFVQRQIGDRIEVGFGKVPGSMLCYTCNYELYAVDYTGKSPTLSYLCGLIRFNLGVHVRIPYRPIRPGRYTGLHAHPLIRSRGDRMIRLIRVCRIGQREDQSESEISVNPVVIVTTTHASLRFE